VTAPPNGWPGPVEIAAGALQLLPLAQQDAHEAQLLLNDPEVQRWMPSVEPFTLEGAKDWISRRLDQVADGTAVAWTVRTAVGGELAGMINLHKIDHEHATAEVGFFVAAAHRGREVARTALDAVSRYAFGPLGIERISLIHAVENLGSCGVARRCGYPLEGITRSSWVIDGVRIDEHLHARVAGDPAV
jgi:RimJ/RimL family protein N-acetyltransferase